MSETTVASGATLAKKLYQEKLFRDVVKETYFGKFMGNNADSLVHVQTDLEKDRGETIVFGLRMRLTGNGVEDDAILEGNEEDLTLYSHTITLKQYRHAVKDNGAMTRQRAMFDVEEESDYAIKDWGTEKIDLLCFNAILDSPTKVFYRDQAAGAISAGSAATATANISLANSKITTSLIKAVKSWSKTGGNRTYVPLRGVKIMGKNYYGLLTHPDAMFDLKEDATFQQWMRDAEVRGDQNPLFTGATAIVDGVVIHEHENVSIANNGGGSTVHYAKSVFMGAQSLLWAFGKRPKLIEKNFDYENKHGKAWAVIARANKPVFNSLDYGSVGIYVAASNISGL